MNSDRVLGALLGTAVGDALGMPIQGLSHQNVRTYYKGIKGYRADEHRRDLDVGQWTGTTQRTFALVHALTETGSTEPVRERYIADLVRLGSEARRWNGSATPDTETVGAAVIAAPLGVWWAATDTNRDDAFDFLSEVLGATHGSAALAAGFGQADAIRVLLTHTPESVDGPAFVAYVADATAWAEARLGVEKGSPSARLRTLADHLDDFPLDLQDLCDGTESAADEAWPFAVAMVARNPLLLEATLLPAINVGGAASAIGACVGALVGALHGWAAFPAWAREGLEDRDRLESEAMALVRTLA